MMKNDTSSWVSYRLRQSISHGGRMSWDRTWKCRNKRMTLQEFSAAVEAVVAEYQGVTGRVEKESDDCWTCFFTVPKEDDDVNTYEVSLYSMGKDGFVLSLEVDASDNRLSEESDQLAEDLAIELDAEPMDL